MIIRRVSRVFAITVGQRLLLGVAPALLAVALVLVLSYYGEFGRQAPGYVVGGAALLAILSLVLTWLNTRHLSLRIRRLAGNTDESLYPPFPQESGDDDLGRIAHELSRLRAANNAAEAALKSERDASERRTREMADMYAASVQSAMQRLEEVRLPLHILVDAPFGELNENQEELLDAARASANEMDGALRRLALLADIERTTLSLHMERLSLNDVIRSVLPMIGAVAERHSARLEVDLDPTLPRILADRARLAEALAMIGTEAARALEPGGVLRVVTHTASAVPTLTMSPSIAKATSERVLGERLLTAMNGHVANENAMTVVFFA